MKRERKNSFRILFVIALYASIFFLAHILGGCKASWYMKKAVEKDPTILKEHKKDTILITKTETKTIFFKSNDTIVDNDLVYIRVFHSNDCTGLFWSVKPQKLITPIDTKEIKYVVVPSKYQVKEENKTKRLEIKEDNKTKRQVLITKKHIYSRRDKTESFADRLKSFIESILWLIIATLVGFIIGRFTKFFKLF